jgi:hypothetical protein
MFCQIGKCISYAEKYNRKLIIDTTHSDLFDKLSNYFTLTELGKNIQLDLTHNEINNFYKDPLFPSETVLQGLNLSPICLCSDQDCSDKFLIHRFYGGGLSSYDALKYFKLQKNIADTIKEKKSKLGHYHAILIRHRDYNTDYIEALNEIVKLNLEIPLFLFTDNHIVQDYAKTLNFKKLYINENLYRSDEVDFPIMFVPNNNPEVSRRGTNVEVLTDLFLAALSEHIYPTYLQGYRGNMQFVDKKIKSGFINLALLLQKDKALLQNLLLC